MKILDDHEQVVTPATADGYRQIVRSLRQSEQEVGSEAWCEETTGEDLAVALGHAEIGLSSFKRYIAAVRWVLLDAQHIKGLAGFDRCVESLPRPAPNKRGTLKFVPVEVSDAVIKMAYSRSSKFSLHLGLLLESTLATGLRPKEWKGALLVLEEPAIRLKVKNGKYVPSDVKNTRSIIPSARRGNGPFRELVFIGDGDAQKDLSEIISQLLIEELSNPWVKVQKSLRRELDVCVEQLISDGVISSLFRKLTIYSFRHQAAADAKATLGTEDGHAAAVLGHAAWSCHGLVPVSFEQCLL